MRYALLAALVLLGCAHPQPAPAATTAASPDPSPREPDAAAAGAPAATAAAPAGSLDEAVDEAIDMLAALSTTIDGVAGCQAQAAALDRWKQDNQATMTKVRAALRAWPEADVKAAAVARLQVRPEAHPIFKAAETCDGNAAFKAAWKDLSDAMQ